MINKLQKIIQNNNKIIDAVDNKKNIDIEKAIKACLLSNNRLAEILIELEYKKIGAKPSNNSNFDMPDIFKDLFKG